MPSAEQPRSRPAAAQPATGVPARAERVPPDAIPGRRELSPEEVLKWRALKRQIQLRAGLCCEGYKDRVLQRRVAVRMRARGVDTHADYSALLERDPQEYVELLDTVTINVSKFFRNASMWVILRDRVLPELARREGEVRIWSAGCAAGEEPYSIAILVRQLAEARRIDAGRVKILATDVDAGALEAAKRAEYGAFAFTEMSDSTRTRWFRGPKRDRLRAEILAMVRFERMDLMSGSLPRDQDLILCRNVLIYFERPVQLALFERFHQALLPGGYLQLGKVETLFGATAGMFATVSARERLFRRV
jgi:chemotaxis methyl-accepting protein methylase